MQKCVKIYKDGGAKIFQKSQVNQPNQGHQPWQSNSLPQGYPFDGNPGAPQKESPELPVGTVEGMNFASKKIETMLH